MSDGATAGCVDELLREKAKAPSVLQPNEAKQVRRTKSLEMEDI